MGGLSHDLRHALRIARLHPGFSALVVATMALGIGLNCAVFSPFLAAVSLLALVAFVAALAPARLAANLDPASALRHE